MQERSCKTATRHPTRAIPLRRSPDLADTTPAPGPAGPDDLVGLARRRALTEDAARPDAVARRHDGGGRTARENITDLVDAGSFVEYGRYAVAAQRSRR